MAAVASNPLIKTKVVADLVYYDTTIKIKYSDLFSAYLPFL